MASFVFSVSKGQGSPNPPKPFNSIEAEREQHPQQSLDQTHHTYLNPSTPERAQGFGVVGWAPTRIQTVLYIRLWPRRSEIPATPPPPRPSKVGFWLPCPRDQRLGQSGFDAQEAARRWIANPTCTPPSPQKNVLGVQSLASPAEASKDLGPGIQVKSSNPTKLSSLKALKAT